MINLYPSKKTPIFNVAFLSALVIIGVFVSFDFGKTESINISKINQWTESTGAGISVPACNSASPPISMSCNPDGTVAVTYNWDLTGVPVVNAASYWFGFYSYQVWYNYVGGGDVIRWITDQPIGSNSFNVSANHAYWYYDYILSNMVEHIDLYSFTTPNCVSTTAPAIDNVTINPSPIIADNSTQYTIMVTASDPDGGADVKSEYTMVNYQGVNAGIYRGYVGWSDQGFPYWDNNFKPGSYMACNGGGSGAIYTRTDGQLPYGSEYINLVSCGTTVSGNQRYVTFVVSFNSNFTSPTDNNTLSGWVMDNSGQIDVTAQATGGWKPFSTFSLAPPVAPPSSFLLTPQTLGGGGILTSPSACNSAMLSWTASTGATGYRILRGSSRMDISSGEPQPYTALNYTDSTVVQNTSYLYQIEAWNSGGTTRSNAVTVTTPYCPPIVDLSASPMFISAHTASAISWNSTYATSCWVDAGWYDIEENQNYYVRFANGLSGVNVSTGNLVYSTRYTATCTGPGGSGTDIATVTILGSPGWKEIIPR
ncbi:MAG: hypothetical protein V1905_01215 [bacterium]